MIIFPGKSKEKNEELTALAEYLELPYKTADLFHEESGENYTPWNYYASGGPSSGQALHFLKIKAPSFAAFEAASMYEGVIRDKGETLARVYFREPVEDMYVKRIDWFQRDKVYAREYYNAAGELYAEALPDGEKDRLVIWRDGEGRPALLFWPDNEIFCVKKEDREFRYGSREEFLKAFLKDFMAEQGEDTILFYEPEMLTYIPEGEKAFLVLFDSVPEEMTEGSFTKRLSGIISMRPGIADAVREKGEDCPPVVMLGSVIRESSERHVQDALIVTRSQNIEGLAQLVSGLPEVHFHIAAGTMMAPGLMEFGKYENVTLYPNYTRERILKLMEKCGIYLDINHYLEYDGIIYAAQRKGLLVLAFDNTVHRREWMPGGHIYRASDADGMMRDFRRVCAEPAYLEKLLGEQRKMIGIDEAQAREFRDFVIGDR